MLGKSSFSLFAALMSTSFRASVAEAKSTMKQAQAAALRYFGIEEDKAKLYWRIGPGRRSVFSRSMRSQSKYTPAGPRRNVVDLNTSYMVGVRGFRIDRTSGKPLV